MNHLMGDDASLRMAAYLLRLICCFPLQIAKMMMPTMLLTFGEESRFQPKNKFCLYFPPPFLLLIPSQLSSPPPLLPVGGQYLHRINQLCWTFFKSNWPKFCLLSSKFMGCRLLDLAQLCRKYQKYNGLQDTNYQNVSPPKLSNKLFDRNKLRDLTNLTGKYFKKSIVDQHM